MLVPVVVAASTSPSPLNVPPVTATVALASARLSGSVTVTLGDSVTSVERPALTEVATPLNVGGSSTFATDRVVVTGVLVSEPPLAVPLGSFKTQVRVRVV